MYKRMEVKYKLVLNRAKLRFSCAIQLGLTYLKISGKYSEIPQGRFLQSG